MATDGSSWANYYERIIRDEVGQEQLTSGMEAQKQQFQVWPSGLFSHIIIMHHYTQLLSTVKTF